ncbi:MAG: poly(3-hydroxybutyrate) depolymerase [Rhodocyclaceae bacterium]|nr:poly(3-hydroxybutyrate) depolymerase [Rhodocyclaceae bacterium]
MKRHILLRRIALYTLLLSAGTASAAPPLPGLAANASNITVSGISSGGYMAVQFQVAYSQQVSGVGVLAGGPYFCAAGSVGRALANCMAPSAKEAPPTPKETLTTITQLAEAGKIDAIKFLSDDRVWLLSGGQDKTVAPAVMDSLAAFYHQLLPEDAVRYVKVPEAGHAMLSVNDAKANACDTSTPPFINRCRDIDAAGQLLTHLLGPLQPAASVPAGEIIAFDQRPYIKGSAIDASMAEEGYAFIPKTCHEGACKVHVAFHGCRQNAREVGRRFIEGAGYNGWAASNRIIVIYPQTAARAGLAFGSTKLILNPKGCWDWWGYTGSDYHTRGGVQMRAVQAMIDAISSAPKR